MENEPVLRLYDHDYIASSFLSVNRNCSDSEAKHGNDGEEDEDGLLNFEGIPVQYVTVCQRSGEYKIDGGDSTDRKEIVIHFEKMQNTTSPDTPESTEAEVYSYACDQFTCGFCTEQYDNLTGFLFHKSQHELAKESFKCELCNKMMRSSDTLKKHYCDHHKIAMIFTRTEKDHSVQQEPDVKPQICVPDSSFPHLESNDGAQTSCEALVSSPVRHESVGPTEASREVSFQTMRATEASREVSFQTKGTTEASHEVSFQTMRATEASHEVSFQTMRATEASHEVSFQAMGTTEASHEVSFQTMGTTEASHEVSLQTMEANEKSHEVSFQTMGTDSQEIDTDSLLDKAAKGCAVIKVVNPKTKTKKKSGSLIQLSKGGALENCVFLLITETSLNSARPFTTHWYCCVLCGDYKTRHRNGFENHLESAHKKVPKEIEIPDPHPIEKLFDSEKVSLKKQVLTLGEYDQRRPVVGANTKRRLETQDVVGEYQCPHCKKVFTRLRYLRRHKMAHCKDVILYFCPECGKKSKSMALLQTHIKKVHKKINKEYECQQCNFKSAVKQDIHKHRQIHTYGTVLCDVCGHAYADNATLKRHKMVHDLSRPFPCTYPGCNWRFKSEVMCNAHVRGHTSVGKFKCSFCMKSFRHKHHLQRHEVSFHNVKAETPRPYNSARSQLTTGIENVSREVAAENLEFKIEDVTLQGEQMLLISSDLGSIHNLIGIRDEVIAWPPGIQTD